MIHRISETRAVRLPGKYDSCVQLFPSMIEADDGTLLLSFSLASEMDAPDSLTWLSESCDNGENWSEPWPIFPEFAKIPRSETVKICYLGGKRIAALGYAFDRPEDAPDLGNPENGGLRDDIVLVSVSEDFGRTWAPYREILTVWGPHVEASAPITVLQDGSWISPITGFPDWNGKMHARCCGRVIRSFDEGKTWNDDAVCMIFDDEKISCYEQRLCQTDAGRICVISWNEDLSGGNLLENHFALSTDNGKTFTLPRSTGVRGQASSVCALGGERILALHSMRRDTDRPGLLASEIDLSGDRWDVVDRRYVWEIGAPIERDVASAEIFAYLKFGQPSAVRLKNGDIMMVHWATTTGIHRVYTTRLRVD